MASSSPLALMRLVQRFHAERLPFGGLAGYCSTWPDAHSADTVAGLGGSALAHGLVVPPSGAARAQALGTWRDLQLRLAGRAAPLAPLATCAAVEEAALALPLLVQASADSLDDLAACSGDGSTRSGDGEPRDAAHVHAEPEAATGGGSGRGAAWEQEAGPVQAVLDGIAARVEAAAPAGLFQERAASGGALAAQLAHLHEGLASACGFKEEPVEWVYTGLGPLLLRDVLQSKKGVAAPLAVLASCVAARLGVPLLPAPPGHGLGAGDAAQPFRWETQVPAETLADHTDGGGAVRLSCLAGALPGDSAQHAQDWPAHLVWAALVRAAVTCHQRRGDSDAVAHCLYQLLALDLAAPEWDAML